MDKCICNINEINKMELPGRTLQWFSIKGQKCPFKSELFSFAVMTIVPGGELPLHEHPKAEELVYIIRGSGEAQIDGTTYLVEPGTALFFNKKALHKLKNTGNTPMLGICFFSPASSPSENIVYVE